jgi:hypothetical protein
MWSVESLKTGGCVGVLAADTIPPALRRDATPELAVEHRDFGDETLVVGALATLTTRRALQMLALARGMAKP